MTFRSRTLRTATIVLAVAALGASTAFASATAMTPHERQVIASRGVGAPYPKVVAPQPATARPKSSGDVAWVPIAVVIAVALATSGALLAGRRRHTPATPR